MGLNLRLFILEHSLAFKCYLNELKFLKSHETAQHHHLRALFSRISGPTLHVSLNGFGILKSCKSVWSISFFFLAANRALIHLIEGETYFFFAQVAIS